jgi:hypothetical protein
VFLYQTRPAVIIKRQTVFRNHVARFFNHLLRKSARRNNASKYTATEKHRFIPISIAPARFEIEKRPVVFGGY